MGTSINAQQHSESEYVKSVQTQTKILMERSVHPLKKSDLLFKLFPSYQQHRRSLKVLHDHTNFVIKKRREELLKKRGDREDNLLDDSDLGMKKRMTFLDLLLCSQLDGQPLPDEIIREEVDTFMFEVTLCSALQAKF